MRGVQEANSRERIEVRFDPRLQRLFDGNSLPGQLGRPGFVQLKQFDVAHFCPFTVRCFPVEKDSKIEFYPCRIMIASIASKIFSSPNERAIMFGSQLGAEPNMVEQMVLWRFSRCLEAVSPRGSGWIIGRIGFIFHGADFSWSR